MIPKKPKILYKELSEQLDLPESMIDNIVSFYYKEVRKTLSSLDQLKVNLPGLGNFLLRTTLVKTRIKKYRTYEKIFNNETFVNYHNKKVAEHKLNKLLEAQKKIDEFLELRNKFRDEREICTDVGEQSSDTGGNQE